MTVPPTFRRRVPIPSVLVLHRGVLGESDILRRSGYAVTTPLRSILDLLRDGTVSRDIVRQAIREARQRGIVTAAEFAEAIARGIKELNNPAWEVDVIIAGRGGGSFEDLMAFNEEIVVRARMKPIATLRDPLPSVDLVTRAATPAAYERSDVTAVPACGVIVEAAVAFVLAQALLEKFGGDHVGDTLAAVAAYCARLGPLGPEGFTSRRG
jgi:hypothetical protein